MASYNGVLWEHWSGADGCREARGCTSTVGSLCHIMLGGSVGEAVFGIGGLRPHRTEWGSVSSIAPVPWLPDAPRGAAVWRSAHGLVTSAWEAVREGSGEWRLWVNVTVPPLSTRAEVRVMMPKPALPTGVCAWECGLASPAGAPSAVQEWVSFDAGHGHRRC